MSARIKYTDENIGNPRVIRNFLPPPEELVFREDTVKVTITLSRRSVDYFKDRAKQYGTQYQRMIRQLLDAYVDSHPADRERRKPRRKTTTR